MSIAAGNHQSRQRKRIWIIQYSHPKDGLQKVIANYAPKFENGFVSFTDSKGGGTQYVGGNVHVQEDSVPA
jgi:hypothetical protein